MIDTVSEGRYCILYLLSSHYCWSERLRDLPFALIPKLFRPSEEYWIEDIGVAMVTNMISQLQESYE